MTLLLATYEKTWYLQRVLESIAAQRRIGLADDESFYWVHLVCRLPASSAELAGPCVSSRPGTVVATELLPDAPVLPVSLSDMETSYLVFLIGSDFLGRYDLIADGPMVTIPELPEFLLNNDTLILPQPSLKIGPAIGLRDVRRPLAVA